MDDFDVEDEHLDNGDEDESSQMPVAREQRPLAFKMTIEGIAEQDLIAIAVRRFEKQLEASFTTEHKKRIDDAIEHAVDAAVARIVETRLDAEINRIIDDGWEERGKWGEKTGRKFSLAQKVTELLREKVDSYGHAEYNGIPRAERFMRKAVEEVFAKELKAELEDAKKRVRKMVDDEVMARLSKTLKEALGLS